MTTNSMKFSSVILIVVVIIILLCACAVKQTGIDNSTNSSNIDSTINNVNESASIHSTSDDNSRTRTGTETNKIIEDFINAISNNDTDTIKSIVSPSGLIVIRNFSSGNGMRGRDIRNVYSADIIPSNLEFEVSGEEPIVLNELFIKSLQIDFANISVENKGDNNFSFQDNYLNDAFGPSTDDIRDICAEIPSLDQYVPTVYNLGDKEIVLTESVLAADLPDGVWVVFEKTDSIFYLRAIIDLR